MMQFYTSEQVKAYAKQLLEDTDYSVLSDVNLLNKNEFISYRSIVRMYLFNPVINAQFPDQPNPIWGNASNTNNEANTNLPTE